MWIKDGAEEDRLVAGTVVEVGEDGLQPRKQRKGGIVQLSQLEDLWYRRWVGKRAIVLDEKISDRLCEVLEGLPLG